MALKVILPQLRPEEVEDLSFQFSWLKKPHSGERLIKTFKGGDKGVTRGTFCLATGGKLRLVAKPDVTAKFYTGHTPTDSGEMWPSSLEFADIDRAH